MSHITTCTTEIQDIREIERACAFLGLKYELNAEVRVWGKKREKADLVLKSPGDYDIGFRKTNSGKFIIVCDHYAWAEFSRIPKLRSITKINSNQTNMEHDTKANFLGLIMQAVALTNAIIEADKQGHKITYSEPDLEGIIHARIEVA